MGKDDRGISLTPSADFIAGFYLGVSITREGFNGECLFDPLWASPRQMEETYEFLTRGCSGEVKMMMVRLLDRAWKLRQEGAK